MVDVSSSANAERWLREQPSTVLVTITARAAMRALPLVSTGKPREIEPLLSTFVLPCFRAALLSWTIANYSRHMELQQFANASVKFADDLFLISPNAVLSRASSVLHNAVIVARDAYIYASNDLEAYRRTVSTGARAVTFCADVFAEAAADSATAAVAAFAAAQTDVEAIELGKSFDQRISIAQALIRAPLWHDSIPTSAGQAWARMQSILMNTGDNWEVWIDWYGDRLAGRVSADPKLDIACAMLPDDLWEQGPKAVNSAVRRLVEASRKPPEDASELFDVEISLLIEAARRIQNAPPEPIPQQGAGPHFTLGVGGMIALAPPAELDLRGNNLTRIRQLLPIVRRASSDLAGRLNPNAFPELAREVADYRAAIAHDEKQIAWGTVFGLGVMLESAAEAARRKIEDRLQPALDDAAQAALDSLLTLHGPLVLATTEGRELADEADRMRLTREEQAKLRGDVLAVARELKNAMEIIERPAANLVAEAAEIIGRGPHPERGTVFGIGAIRNVAIGLVGAAAVTAAFGVGFIQAGAALVAIEALKKSQKFSALTAMLGQNIDRVFRIGAAYRGFVIANQEPLRRIAANNTQLRWMLPHIDRIVETGTARHTNPA
jgi:hypothetical protein